MSEINNRLKIVDKIAKILIMAKKNKFAYHVSKKLKDN